MNQTRKRNKTLPLLTTGRASVLLYDIREPPRPEPIFSHMAREEAFESGEYDVVLVPAVDLEHLAHRLPRRRQFAHGRRARYSRLGYHSQLFQLGDSLAERL